MTRVLVLRPEPGASATVKRARALGLDAVAVPLFEVQPLEWQAPETPEFDGLLLTSGSAVRAAGERLQVFRNLKVYSVGQATAEAAAEMGFEIAAIGDGGVDRLLASIDSDLKLLHLCGADRREPLNPAQSITPIAVYRSTPIGAPDLSAATGNIALIHSPRAAQRFGELVGDRSSITIAAISDAAAEGGGAGWKAVAVADRPSDDALLALAASLCNKPDPK